MHFILNKLGFTDVRKIFINKSTENAILEKACEEAKEMANNFLFNDKPLFQPKYEKFERKDNFENGKKLLFITSSPLGIFNNE